jgi:hypothetical protein
MKEMPESVPGQCLGGDVCELRLCRTIFEGNHANCYLFTSKVILYIEMFCALVVSGVISKGDTGLIILPNGGPVFLQVA